MSVNSKKKKFINLVSKHFSNSFITLFILLVIYYRYESIK